MSMISSRVLHDLLLHLGYLSLVSVILLCDLSSSVFFSVLFTVRRGQLTSYDFASGMNRFREAVFYLLAVMFAV